MMSCHVLALLAFGIHFVGTGCFYLVLTAGVWGLRRINGTHVGIWV